MVDRSLPYTFQVVVAILNCLPSSTRLTASINPLAAPSCRQCGRPYAPVIVDDADLSATQRSRAMMKINEKLCSDAFFALLLFLHTEQSRTFASTRVSALLHAGCVSNEGRSSAKVPCYENIDTNNWKSPPVAWYGPLHRVSISIYMFDESKTNYALLRTCR
jgi:hypothetical protein